MQEIPAEMWEAQVVQDSLQYLDRWDCLGARILYLEELEKLVELFQLEGVTRKDFTDAEYAAWNKAKTYVFDMKRR